MSAGVPLRCMATKAAPCSAATGARLEEMSFRMVAPADRAALATEALLVSTDTRTSPASASMTGTTRRSSSSSATAVGARPGRLTADVDHVRAFGHHLAAATHGIVEVEVEAAVGERVGCDVQHAHHKGEHASRVERFRCLCLARAPWLLPGSSGRNGTGPAPRR